MTVDILGFTEVERNQFIQQALKEQPQSIKELTQYLEDHFTISSLCVVPFNMVVLLFLYKQRSSLPNNSLPNNSTQLYNYFICLTIRRHLAKYGYPLDNTITDLTNLPDPFGEIKAACPDIAAVPGAINGFGLHVACLSPSKELKIISITKGQHPSFKQSFKPSLGRRLKGFLTGEQVENRFLEDKVKCFHLFRCFFEADDKEMCRSIENAESLNLNSKIINLYDDTLPPSDVECVTVFLTCSSHKKWEMLGLQKCYIQDHGLHILHRGLTSCGVTITTLDLNNNSLTESSSSAISDITISCRVKRLYINHNHTVGEDERLYSIICDPSSMLEELYMWSTKLLSSGAIELFTALSEGKKLRILDIAGNVITDEACDAIIMAMKNNSLIRLDIDSNPISGECAQLIVQALQHNNTLQLLYLPDYSDDVKERIRLSAEEVNKKRESRNCQVKLKIYYR